MSWAGFNISDGDIIRDLYIWLEPMNRCR